jgi:F-type H+-transporting ATPase subunit b
VVVYLGVHKKVANELDARALRISKELEEVRRLREEAEKLLADNRRKLGDVVTEVDNTGSHREALTQARCTQKACCAHAP